MSNYIDYVCRSYDMARDLSRFVVLSVNVMNRRNNTLYIWTHCEWFKFEMPLEHLYNWINDLEPDLKDVTFSLTCKLNDNHIVPIMKTNSQTLKDICASHIMELECTGR